VLQENSGACFLVTCDGATVPSLQQIAERSRGGHASGASNEVHRRSGASIAAVFLFASLHSCHRCALESKGKGEEMQMGMRTRTNRFGVGKVVSEVVVGSDA
jgi:hypothetical protein